MQDMIKAILRIIFEAPEKSEADEKNLPLIACHEAGHALVAELLDPDSVNLVTVLSHDSETAGVTSIYKDESYLNTGKKIENRIMTLLAGKAATEICYGLVDTGVALDMRRTFDIVRRLVDSYCAYGFDQFVFTRDHSDEAIDRRDSRIAAEVAHYYARTRQLLVENREKLDLLIARLMEEKTLLGDQVQEILREIDSRISIHDFRMVQGQGHTNLIFDMALPADLMSRQKEIKKKLDNRLNELGQTTYYTVITFDLASFNN